MASTAVLKHAKLTIAAATIRTSEVVVLFREIREDFKIQGCPGAMHATQIMLQSKTPFTASLLHEIRKLSKVQEFPGAMRANRIRLADKQECKNARLGLRGITSPRTAENSPGLAMTSSQSASLTRSHFSRRLAMPCWRSDRKRSDDCRHIIASSLKRVEFSLLEPDEIPLQEGGQRRPAAGYMEFTCFRQPVSADLITVGKRLEEVSGHFQFLL